MLFIVIDLPSGPVRPRRHSLSNTVRTSHPETY